MVPQLRKTFNQNFTVERYENFLSDLNSWFPGAIEFRVAETPVFANKAFKKMILDACEAIVDIVLDDSFKQLTDRAIPLMEYVKNENERCQMIVFDFGVCVNEKNELEPQLIEMQGFPSLYGFQAYYPEVVRKHFSIPDQYSHYFNGYDQKRYLEMLKTLLLAGHHAENVILLEIKPHQQKTKIDFYCTEEYTGVRPVCITEVFAEGKKLYYNREGVKTPIHRIYNRVIFDDLKAQKDLGDIIDITRDWEVEWMPHPNWFYRISKFTLPFIKHPYVPETTFLNEVQSIPHDLENYVLKPLFSFAGQGVIIDVQRSDIEGIVDPENWILQKKVTYADVIKTPDIPAKVEIRVMYVWPDGASRPHAATNLSRLSKGKMIGVRYNKDKEWVGGSVCYFEED